MRLGDPRSIGLFAFAALLTVCPVLAAAQTKAAVLSAELTVRTSLKVSAHVLQFDVAEADGAATAAIDFSAAARLPLHGEVVLTVEPVRAPIGPGGAADVDTFISFTGEGAGTSSGDVILNVATTAARWTSSGHRTGRLIFTFRAAAPGRYVVPVRFMLVTP